MKNEVRVNLDAHAAFILGSLILVNRTEELSQTTRQWIKQKLDHALNNYCFDNEYAYYLGPEVEKCDQ